jgi:hypothetical protein
MNDLRAFFFESPLQLAMTLAVIEMLLIGVWRSQRTRVTQRLVLGGLAVSVFLIFQSQLVLTDGERVKATCLGLGQAVDEGDVDAFGSLLADTFASDEWEKEDLVEEMYRVLERYTVDDVRIDRFQVDLVGDRAAVSFRARAWVRNAPNANPDFFSRWEAELIRERETDWLVQSLKMIKYGPVDVNGLRSIMAGW